MAMEIDERECQAEFPLRVICIKETFESGGGICFDVPGDWNFDIISHTWTENARDWSLEIADTMTAESTGESSSSTQKLGIVDAYAERFKQGRFAEKPGYTDLVEFLRMLAADGVERVWFDALCINQKDDKDNKEREREMAQMGKYYARSRGCYVWCHGMGGGFRLWAEGKDPKYYTLPRWFTRVWTLQEFVLPSKLAFIVGMDMAGCTAMFAYKAYCRSKRLSWRPAEHIDDLTETKFVKRFDSTRQVDSQALFPCPHCNHHQQRDHLYNHQQHGHVYFVERSQYFELMDRSIPKSIEVGRLPPDFSNEFKSPLHRLKAVLSCNDELRNLELAALVVREISVRYCHVDHDEDRLLSILGLLQMEGRMQLRTGRRLHDQIYDMAQSLATSRDEQHHHRFLLFLCVAQYRGSTVEFMSWAPTLASQKVLGDMRLQSLSLFHSFTSIAQVEGLDERRLMLGCRFLRAKVVPFAQHWETCKSCRRCRQAAQLEHMHHFILEVENHHHHYSVLVWAYSDEDYDENELRFLSISPPTFTMSIKSDVGVETLRTMSFHVVLLLVGQDQLPGLSQPFGMFLVCVGEEKPNLHKVGVFIGGPGWGPEALEEPGKYDTPDTQSANSMSDSGEDACFNNEELENFQDSQVVPWKDKFPIAAQVGEEEEDEEEEGNEEEGNEEEEGEEEEEEVAANNPTWEQDVQGMKRDRFVVGGFGETVPSSILTSDKIFE